MQSAPSHHRAVALVLALAAALALTGVGAPPAPTRPPSVALRRRPTSLVDPNTATRAELVTLPGVGPAIASRIIASRAERPFTDADDLARVRGIGPRTVARLRPRLTFAPVRGRERSAAPRSP